MQLLYVDPCTDPLWQHLIEKRTSSVFHSPAWLHTIMETYGFDIQTLLVVDESGEPLAGLPFCRITDIVGDRLVSLPFSDYCDPLVDDVTLWKVLSDTLAQEACPMVVRCLHNDIPCTDPRFTRFKQAKWHGLNLQPELDTLWQGLESSARRAINKASRSGVTVRMAQDISELRAFFELHLRVRKHKYQLLAQPYRMFESIWEHFMAKGQGFLLLATYDNQIVAGIVFLAWKDCLYYKFNASDSTNLTLRPNDLMIWEAIQYARAQGYTQLDFGLSDWHQEGLVHYKRKFASEEKTISFLQYTPASAPAPQGQDVRRVLGQLTALLTEPSVSDQVTEKAGDLLYQYFA